MNLIEFHINYRDGDIYAAFKDCQTTLLLDPGHVKAHFR